MNYSSKTPKYRAQPVTNSLQAPMVGCIYSGDAGNSDWHTGMLISVDKNDATIVDIRHQTHVVWAPTMRSLQGATPSI
jgi:hypothetical protein